ncbi:hypothetical protein BGT96224_Ac31368 [Blumeria graminis f. sp. tritici 96224]|nr:hypothetical protein BGT96224_Ac31368 [Blumeria graminis f. sp. tritici 96224]
MHKRPADYEPLIQDTKKDTVVSEYLDEEISHQLPPQNKNDVVSNSLVNFSVQNDAQSEDELVVIPENLIFLKEAFSKKGAAQLPPLRKGTDMIVDIPDGKLSRAGFVDAKHRHQQTYFLSKNLIPMSQEYAWATGISMLLQQKINILCQISKIYYINFVELDTLHVLTLSPLII